MTLIDPDAKRFMIFDYESRRWYSVDSIRDIPEGSCFYMMKKDWKTLYTDGELVLYCDKNECDSTNGTFQYRPLIKAIRESIRNGNLIERDLRLIMLR